MNALTYFAFLLLALSLAACSSDSPPAPVEDRPSEEGGAAADAGQDPAPAQDPVAAMRADIATLEAKAEHTAPQVKVQHLLVSFQGAGVPGVTRTKEEAEVLAAELWKRIHSGEDFDALVKQYTNDSHPGIYPMTTASRRGMVPGFGNVGWRLEVNEFGIAPFDARKSPYGWHIIKRVE